VQGKGASKKPTIVVSPYIVTQNSRLWPATHSTGGRVLMTTLTSDVLGWMISLITMVCLQQCPEHAQDRKWLLRGRLEVLRIRLSNAHSRETRNSHIDAQPYTLRPAYRQIRPYPSFPPPCRKGAMQTAHPLSSRGSVSECALLGCTKTRNARIVAVAGFR